MSSIQATLEVPAPFLEGFATIHGAMRRDVERLPGAIAGLESSRDARALLRWFRHFARAIEAHHQREDAVVWPALAERCPDFAPLRAHLVEDHTALDASLTATRQAIEDLTPRRSGQYPPLRWVLTGSLIDEGAIDAAVAAADSLRGFLTEHLDREEDAAFPRLAAEFTFDEYRGLETTMVRGMGLSDLAFEMPWSLEGVDNETRRRLVGAVPAAIRLADQAVFSRRYRRLAAPVRDQATSSNRPSRHDLGGRLFIAVNRVMNSVVGRLPIKRFRGAPVLKLTTVGRRTGRSRTTPLIYLRDADRWIVVASNGGADWEPGWLRNVVAGMPADIRVDGERIEVTGTEVEGAERDRLWRRLNDEVWDYDAYQANVSRRLAVVALERVGLARERLRTIPIPVSRQDPRVEARSSRPSCEATA